MRVELPITLLLILFAGCRGELAQWSPDAASPPDGDGGAPVEMLGGPSASIDLSPLPSRSEHDEIAPAGQMLGETVEPGAGPIDLTLGTSDWGPAVRVDAEAAEYVGFFLDRLPGAAVHMQVLRWEGGEVVEMATTTAGDGVRALATRDPESSRTFWVRARNAAGSARLTITRTSLGEGACGEACSDLVQLPLPIDASVQGYAPAPGVIYRYQFGRRDLIMAILGAGRAIASAGIAPFTVKDLSRWDGSRPPGHATHNDGFHADLSIYDQAGRATWALACAASSCGCRCSRNDGSFGSREMAVLIAGLFESGLFEVPLYDGILLDTHLHAPLFEAASELHGEGVISDGAHALFRPEVVRHVDYHHHHIHVRVD